MVGEVKWLHNVSGDKEEHEISVVRSDNEHGFKSFGWDHPCKKFILFASGESFGCDTEEEFAVRVLIAEKFAKLLNDERYEIEA